MCSLYLITHAKGDKQCDRQFKHNKRDYKCHWYLQSVHTCRKNEGMEPKQKQYPVVDVTGDRGKGEHS